MSWTIPSVFIIPLEFDCMIGWVGCIKMGLPYSSLYIYDTHIYIYVYTHIHSPSMTSSWMNNTLTPKMGKEIEQGSDGDHADGEARNLLGSSGHCASLRPSTTGINAAWLQVFGLRTIEEILQIQEHVRVPSASLLGGAMRC